MRKYAWEDYNKSDKGETMGVTVERILALQTMKGSRLIAGVEGRKKIVNSVSMMETPDSTMWLREGDFILTNGRPIRDMPGPPEGLIEVFLRKKVAGLAVKLGRYIKELPEPMVRRANERNFPIVVLPEELTAAQIITCISYEIFRSEARDPHYSYEEDFLRDLVTGEEDWRVLRNRLNMIGWSERKMLGVAVIQHDAMRLDYTFSELCEGTPFTYGFAVSGRYVALMELDGESQPDTRLYQCAHELLDHLEEKNTFGGTFSIGIGRCYRSLSYLSRSFEEARTALCMGVCQKQGSSVTSFARMGVMSILLAKNNRVALERLYGNLFMALDQHDRENDTEYVETLKAYAMCNMSLEETAKHLYVHYNTVRYRLNALKMLLGNQLVDEDMGIEFNLEAICCVVRWKAEFVKSWGGSPFDDYNSHRLAPHRQDRHRSNSNKKSSGGRKKTTKKKPSSQE